MEEDRSEDAFFTGGGYKEVPRDATAPGITIQVDPLPAKPEDFSGGVGKFNISAQLAKTEVRAGDPINLRLVLSGTGNLKLVKEPAVQIPSDFDKYDTKITDKTKLSEAGVEGNMIYDYLFVARKEGTYTIPAIRFTYYDTGSNSYKTITTQPLHHQGGQRQRQWWHERLRQRREQGHSTDKDRQHLGAQDWRLLLRLRSLLGYNHRALSRLRISVLQFPKDRPHALRHRRDETQQRQQDSHPPSAPCRRADAQGQEQRVLRRGDESPLGLRQRQAQHPRRAPQQR